jgi:hypothetical protein
MRRCLRDFYAAGIPMASTSRNLTPARGPRRKRKRAGAQAEQF